jgi:hypothetical protein
MKTQIVVPVVGNVSEADSRTCNHRNEVPGASCPIAEPVFTHACQSDDLAKKLFGGDEGPDEKIKQQIEEGNPGISDLDVSFDRGVWLCSIEISLKGAMKSNPHKEQASHEAGLVNTECEFID